MAILLYMHYYSVLRKRIVWKEIIQKQAMYRFFQVNRDIFFRTLCLVVVTMFFTSAGAAQGEIVLAVNTLLMQLFTPVSYTHLLCSKKCIIRQVWSSSLLTYPIWHS